jgi:hypothetical protein
MDILSEILSGCGWEALQALWRVLLPLGLVIAGFVLIFMFDNLVGGLICISSGIIIGLYFWRTATRHDL